MTPKDSHNLLLPKAHALYRAGDFQGAKEAYETAGSVLGEKIVQANIRLCDLRIKSTANLIAGKLTKADKGNESDNTEIGQPEDRIRLTNEPQWLRKEVSETNGIRITAAVDCLDNSRKSCIALARAFDEEGQPIPPENINLPFSTAFNCSFAYFHGEGSERKELALIKSNQSITAIELGLARFDNKTGLPAFVNKIKFEQCLPHISAKTRTTNPPKPKAANEFRVAIIADEFTVNSFEGEFILLPIEPSNWEEIFEESKPDIFFCESAWSGPNSQKRPWKGKIYPSVNFNNENRTVLLAILDYCRKEGVPTVFWNKEDPTHYSDRVHDFVRTSMLFDYVFTTAVECVDGYKKINRLKNVFPLPFATNPRLFNPIENEKRDAEVVFAGSWYQNHTERSRVMSAILDSLINDGFDLQIFDRYHLDSDPMHQWPTRFAKYIKPGLAHNKISEAYKSSIYGLNINTVTDSSTMFARRVFELMSSNTLVVSNYSQGVDELFGDMVVFHDRDPEMLKSLTEHEVDSMRHKALNEVLEKHTYKQRWRSILKRVGLPFEENDTTLTFTYVVKEKKDAYSAISWYQQHGVQFPGSRLLLVTDVSMDPLEVAKFYQEFNRFGISVTSMLHAEKYAIPGRYRPVETSHFAVLSPSQFADAGKIKQGALHLQYMTKHLVALAERPDQRYKMASASVNAPVMGNANQFMAWMHPETKQSNS
ncbi:MAG: glycosyltransferase, partial [Cyanobium sp.]